MNIIVIGLGSMGKRRVRLLLKYLKINHIDNGKVIGVDLNDERQRECVELYGIETFSSLHEAQKKHVADMAIISTSPLSHNMLIRECLYMGMHVFTELNLVDTGYDDNIALARNRHRVLFMSSTFLYRKEVQYIKNKVEEMNFIGMYRYHIGQYLPSWHPWEAYEDFFVKNVQTNGCREIFAIELPWLVYCFGKINKIYSVHNKLSDLKVEYDDSYQVIIEHMSGTVGCLTVDIVAPRTQREFEMWKENFYISWDGTPKNLREYCADEETMKNVPMYDLVEQQSNYYKYIVENAYYDELNNFFEVIEGKNNAIYSFEQDKEILGIIDEIEKE